MKERWVVGLAATEFSPPRPIFYTVKQRNAATLQRIVSEHCLSGRTIHSEGCRVYLGLAALGFVHQSVKHRQNCVVPSTGYCE